MGCCTLKPLSIDTIKMYLWLQIVYEISGKIQYTTIWVVTTSWTTNSVPVRLEQWLDRYWLFPGLRLHPENRTQISRILAVLCIFSSTDHLFYILKHPWSINARMCHSLNCNYSRYERGRWDEVILLEWMGVACEWNSQLEGSSMEGSVEVADRRWSVCAQTSCRNNT